MNTNVSSLIDSPIAVSDAIVKFTKINSGMGNDIRLVLSVIADGKIPDEVYEFFMPKDVQATDRVLGECNDVEKLYLMASAKCRSQVAPLTSFLKNKRNQEERPLECDEKIIQREIAKMSTRILEAHARLSVATRLREEIGGKKIEYRKGWAIVVQQ